MSTDPRSAQDGAPARTGLKAVTFAVIGLGSLVAAAVPLWRATAEFRLGNVAEGMGILAFLPLYAAGVSAGCEQFLRGDGSRDAFQMLPLLLVCLLLSALSHTVL